VDLVVDVALAGKVGAAADAASVVKAGKVGAAADAASVVKAGKVGAAADAASVVKVGAAARRVAGTVVSAQAAVNDAQREPRALLALHAMAQQKKPTKNTKSAWWTSRAWRR
jgi:hypothetical protein